MGKQEMSNWVDVWYESYLSWSYHLSNIYIYIYIYLDIKINIMATLKKINIYIYIYIYDKT